MSRWTLPLMLGLLACPDPGETPLQVGYRDSLGDGGDNGERGNVKISEVMWSGSVRETEDGRVYDPNDVFIEIQNVGARPLNLTGWQLEVRGAMTRTYVLPPTDVQIEVGKQLFVAAKDDGCFTNATWILPELQLPRNDNFSITLRDLDERLIEGAGDYTMRPFAGGYDLVMSRSMEMANIMFGARGNQPHAWHHYTDAEVDVPNQTNVDPACRRYTGASPGLPNSPDYSGSFAAGAFD